jgi:hypothetical protein
VHRATFERRAILPSITAKARASQLRQHANKACIDQRHRPAIGAGYARISNPYLSPRLLSASEAAPRMRFGQMLRAAAHRKGHTMLESKLTRRGLVATAATGVAAVGLLGASVESADAYQGNMERALASLFQALASLRESTANKGGHRARAMELVRDAITETQAGIEFADEHGGG